MASTTWDGVSETEEEEEGLLTIDYKRLFVFAKDVKQWKGDSKRPENERKR